MGNDQYREFIREAFIDPIRSVLIVDDDYPTYDDILTAPDQASISVGAKGQKRWRDHPERIANLISTFRQRPRPLLVDIHDGSNVSLRKDVVAAAHLHQCDLLVLDYELDKGKPQDGTRAIQILRGLMSNNHFNLVIIYTNEQLDVVFDAVRWGLITGSTEVLTESEVESAGELIFDGESSLEGFETHLLGTVGAAQYFHSRRYPSAYLRTMAKGEEPYKLFNLQADQVDWSRDQRRLVLRYLLKKVEDVNGVNIGRSGRFANLEWSRKSPNWIKSDSAFVAMSNKTDNHDDLLSELQTALVHWNPRPSRLLLTKLRAEMDDYGVSAQGPALANHHALAYWYYRLLKSSGVEDRRWQVRESVSRHSEQLLQTILPRVEDYASRLIDSEVAAGDAIRTCVDRFGVNVGRDADRTRAALEHNALVCSMEPVGWHLTTGHVFAMSDQHWLCLSPACDMVPSQIPDWRTDSLGRRLPFIAARLHPIGTTKVPSEIHSNRFLFMRIQGQLRGFCFNDPSGEESGPRWDLLYAERSGQFTGRDFQFAVSRIERGKRKLLSIRNEARVIGQLRYEYALNLIQKFGASLTRVGLDFADGR